MGYFSNGTEGADYEDMFCARCIHGDETGAGKCPVMLAHYLYNYAEADKPNSILHLLIPITDDDLNAECAMFVERGGDDG